MNELKKQTMDVINQINQDWVESLKDAEREGKGIDLSEMMGKFSENIKKLDQHFRDANERIKPKKKGWMK